MYISKEIDKQVSKTACGEILPCSESVLQYPVFLIYGSHVFSQSRSLTFGERGVIICSGELVVEQLCAPCH